MKRLGGSLPFFAGLLFAVGLGVGGMTNPRKVMAFLDVFGRWDPSLLLVMGGAVLVHLPFLRWMGTRPPSGPERPDVTLIAGAAIFGVGWGLSGYCPGPAVVSLASGASGAIVFVLAMLVGFVLAGDRGDSVC